MGVVQAWDIIRTDHAEIDVALLCVSIGDELGV